VQRDLPIVHVHHFPDSDWCADLHLHVRTQEACSGVEARDRFGAF